MRGPSMDNTNGDDEMKKYTADDGSVIYKHNNGTCEDQSEENDRFYAEELFKKWYREGGNNGLFDRTTDNTVLPGDVLDWLIEHRTHIQILFGNMGESK